MPIDPTIALGFRPPQVNLDVPSPIHQFGQLMTLRGLMEQSQMRRMQTEQEQFKLDDLRRANEGEMRFRRRILAGESLTPAQTIGELGPQRGVQFLKSAAELQEQETKRKHAQEEQQEKYLRMLGQAGLASRNQQDRDFRVKLLVRGGVIPQEMADEMLATPFDLEATQAFGRQFMSIADQMRDQREAAARAHQAKLEPFQLRTAEAGATKAEQETTGTQPITLQQKAAAEQQLWADAGGLISIINDPNRSPADRARAQRGLQQHQNLRSAGATQIITPNQNLGNEARLRDDYRQDTKEYVTIRNAYNKITSSAKAGTAAGDIALIYGFMKLMDPGSTVREGERADASNAGGIPERIRALYNKAIDGESLTPGMRSDFVARSKENFDQYHADYLKTKDMYTGIAQRGGMDPRNVVIDYSTATPNSVPLKDGTVAVFPSGAAAEAFKRDNPGLVK